MKPGDPVSRRIAGHCLVLLQVGWRRIRIAATHLPGPQAQQVLQWKRRYSVFFSCLYINPFCLHFMEHPLLVLDQSWQISACLKECILLGQERIEPRKNGEASLTSSIFTEEAHEISVCWTEQRKWEQQTWSQEIPENGWHSWWAHFSCVNVGSACSNYSEVLISPLLFSICAWTFSSHYSIFIWSRCEFFSGTQKEFS